MDVAVQADNRPEMPDDAGELEYVGMADLYPWGKRLAAPFLDMLMTPPW